MNADHAAQLRLLDLQAADTALAQLQHRRATLPELAQIAEREQRRNDLELEAVDARTRAGDIAIAQRRLENEVDAVRGRAARDEQRLQTGGVPAKELSGLQHEISTLARRQSTLEDELLDVMEQYESADTAATDLGRQLSTLAAERDELIAARDAAFAEIDAAATQHIAERTSIGGELPPDLLALYERARGQGGGVGAARLVQRHCDGCHIDLAGTELAALRAAAPDDVVRCENCRRILVRTDESGL